MNKTIGQGLLNSWNKSKSTDTNTSKTAPLEDYLMHNYKERHVALCTRLGIEPLTFSEWLLKPIKTITEN